MMCDGGDQRLVFTANEVAAMLQVSMATLRRLTAHAPHYRMAGRKRVFTRDDLARFLEALPTPQNHECSGEPRGGTSIVRRTGTLKALARIEQRKRERRIAADARREIAKAERRKDRESCGTP